MVRFTRTMEILSCAVLNGGDSETDALFIMQVGKDYSDPDPQTHAARVRDSLGLPANSVGMMTAAEVGKVFSMSTSDFGGCEVSAVATAGLSNHVVAGEVLENYPERRKVSDRRASRLAGTINIAVIASEPLSMEGKVNMFIPLVEAKTAALNDRGYRETGTTSDSMAVLCPKGDVRVDYTGTGSDMGISAARAVRSAVGKALAARDEHPVMEEVSGALGRAGIPMDDLKALAPKDMSDREIVDILGQPKNRALIDLAIHCAGRADSMADDGNGSLRELIEDLTETTTTVVADCDKGTLKAVLTAILNKPR